MNIYEAKWVKVVYIVSKTVYQECQMSFCLCFYFISSSIHVNSFYQADMMRGLLFSIRHFSDRHNMEIMAALVS